MRAEARTKVAEHLYTVRVRGHRALGLAADPNTEIPAIELFEPYLGAGMSEPDPPIAVCALRSMETILVEETDLLAEVDRHDHRALRAGHRPAQRREGRRARLGRSGVQAPAARPTAPAAIAELGFGGDEGDHMQVVENTDAIHNVVVCTLCSCYPWPVLGLPPAWYKPAPYRARMVREPRAVLAEMGCGLDDVEIAVWDSSAEQRYLVLPQRPPGHQGRVRGGAGGAGHARRDDRGRAAVSGLDGVDVPRRNGELAFDAPWQSRAFGLAAAVPRGVRA